MTKRYYYTDPIKALWMMREFGVEFEGSYEDEGEFHSFKLLGVDAEDIEGFLYSMANSYPKKLYVCKESEGIFELKEDDFGRANEDDKFDWPVSFQDNEWVEYGYYGQAVSGDKVEIIMRDNKHFFQPLIEE